MSPPKPSPAETNSCLGRRPLLGSQPAGPGQLFRSCTTLLGDNVIPVSTYVLIPGGWHAAWCWWPVAKRLRAAGHHAIALTLPGLNDGDDPAGYRLTDAVDYVVSQVRGLQLDVILV